MVTLAGSPVQQPSFLVLCSACSDCHVARPSQCGISTVGGLALRSVRSMMMTRSIPTRSRPSPSSERTEKARGYSLYPLDCLALSALAASVTRTAHGTTSSQTRTAASTGRLFVMEDPVMPRVRAKLAPEVVRMGGRTLSLHRSATWRAVRAGDRILENRRLLAIGRSVVMTHSRQRLPSWRADWSATSYQSSQALRTTSTRILSRIQIHQLRSCTTIFPDEHPSHRKTPKRSDPQRLR